MGRGSCKHHWIIDEAKSQTSKGVCRLCGEMRDDFDNGPSFGGHSLWRQPETLEMKEHLQPARFRIHEGAISL